MWHVMGKMSWWITVVERSKRTNEGVSHIPARPAVYEERADMMLLATARSSPIDRRYDQLMAALVYCISLRP
jgi:hypothetical protein